MLPIDPHHDYATCMGPPSCNYCLAIFTEDESRQYERIRAEDSVRLRGMRTACADKPRNYAPPDPYAADIRKLRQQNTQPGRWPKQPTPSSSPKSYTPPDPYAKALDQMKKGTNR